MWKELNSHMIIFVHKHGRRDVMWKRSFKYCIMISPLCKSFLVHVIREVVIEPSSPGKEKGKKTGNFMGESLFTIFASLTYA